MTNIFFAEDMAGTLFHERSRRNLTLPGDILIVDDPEKADVIIARFHYLLADYFHLRRSYYLWTHDPHFCQATGKEFTDVTGERIYVSSAFNGDIYTDPLYYFQFKPSPMDHDDLRRLVEAKTKPCVVVASYRKKLDRYVGNLNVDLCEYRQRIAVYFQRRHGFCDVYGKNWPADVAISGENRFGTAEASWRDAKLNILSDYAFNLCTENTLLENYVTEKIWDAYWSGCVPIYFGRGSGVYDILSEGTFVDCSAITSIPELYEYVSSMSVEQRLRILENAFADIEEVRRSSSKKEVVSGVIERFVNRVRDMN